MQLVYGQQPAKSLGAVATTEDAVIDSYTIEVLPQISTLTVGGTATAGVYAVTATGPDGETATATFTRVAEANAAIATALYDLMVVDPDWLAITDSIADNGAGVITVTYKPGRAYTHVMTVTAPGTFVAANTQSVTDADTLQLGVAAAYGSADDLVAAVVSGTTDADIAGIVVKGVDALVNDFGEANDDYEPGMTVSVLRRGECWVLTEDAVTKGGSVYYRKANAGTGDPLGLFRSDTDGGDAVLMTGAKYAETTTGRGLAKVTINRP